MALLVERQMPTMEASRVLTAIGKLRRLGHTTNSAPRTIIFDYWAKTTIGGICQSSRCGFAFIMTTR